ncbi:hypothetical protein [Microvirga ossetica]|uniref:hypothetical protein n=1 Tax=Microvirga ossetica TaxID=1882682 RepID=UPI000C14FD6C|nr:hypothetical protein [Microvirga ossetica]
MIDKVGGKGSIGANVTAFFEAGHVASTIGHCSDLNSNELRFLERRHHRRAAETHAGDPDR